MDVVHRSALARGVQWGDTEQLTRAMQFLGFRQGSGLLTTAPLLKRCSIAASEGEGITSDDREQPQADRS